MNIQAQKCGGIIGLWKKYILDNFDNQNQGKKKIWTPTFRAEATCTNKSNLTGRLASAS